MMGDTMAHMYWTVPCMTEKCPGLHVANYIGEYDPRGKTFTPPAVMPETFQVQCELCLQIHTYSWEKLTPRELPSAPTPYFHPWF